MTSNLNKAKSNLPGDTLCALDRTSIEDEVMPNSGRISELLKQLDEDTVWQTVVWNEAFESNIITNEVFEANIVIDTTEAKSGQSMTVLQSEEERARIEIRTTDREDHEEWTYLQNDLYNSKETSGFSVPKNSGLRRHTCTVNKLFLDEDRERSNQGMPKRMKHQTNHRAVRQGNLTNNPLEVRFNSLREDYLRFLRSQRSLPEEVDCPRSPGLVKVSDFEKESNHQERQDYRQTIDLAVKPGTGKPPTVPWTTDVRRCPSTGENETNQPGLVLRNRKENQSPKEPPETPATPDVSAIFCRYAGEDETNQQALELRIGKENESRQEPPKVPATSDVRVARSPSDGEERSNARALVLRIGNKSLEETPPVPTTADVRARHCRSARDWESDHRDLVLKIENENQSLKALLADFILRNELQATTINGINHRLDGLETKLEKSKSSKKFGKDHAHHSRVSSKSKTRKEQPNTITTNLCRS